MAVRLDRTDVSFVEKHYPDLAKRQLVSVALDAALTLETPIAKYYDLAVEAGLLPATAKRNIPKVDSERRRLFVVARHLAGSFYAFNLRSMHFANPLERISQALNGEITRGWVYSFIDTLIYQQLVKKHPEFGMKADRIYAALWNSNHRMGIPAEPVRMSA